jgi:hypothetical protein
MEIGNINGSNAYTANSNPTGNVPLEDKRTQIPGDTQNQETPPSSQQAFQVNITQEAQDRLAAETTPPPVQATRSDNDSDNGSQNQRPGSAQQLVNIIA